MAKYEEKRIVLDEYDLMCSDCEVHEIEYWEETTEDKLHEDYKCELEHEDEMKWLAEQNDTEYEPLPKTFEEYIELLIKEGWIRKVA